MFFVCVWVTNGLQLILKGRIFVLLGVWVTFDWHLFQMVCS